MLWWQISDISYTKYNALLLYSRQVAIEVYTPGLTCLPLAMIRFSSFRFRLIVSTCRNRFIGFWLYTPFRVLLWCFCTVARIIKKWSGSQYFTLACLLIARATCTDNPLSIRHCSVFTPCERIPLSTIYPISPCGTACAVLFVCLLLFRRLTDNGPNAVIGDSALQTWFSMLLATCTSIQFSILNPSP